MEGSGADEQVTEDQGTASEDYWVPRLGANEQVPEPEADDQMSRPADEHYQVEELETNLQRTGVSRMRRMYVMETCRCLIRKWKFCRHIRSLADTESEGEE